MAHITYLQQKTHILPLSDYLSKIQCIKHEKLSIKTSSKNVSHIGRFLKGLIIDIKQKIVYLAWIINIMPQ